MSSISSLGAGSGLNLADLVDKLVQAERAPATNRLNLQEAQVQGKFSAYGALKGALADFQTSVSNLAQLSAFQSRAVTYVNSTEAFTMSASASAEKGNYNIEVTSVAKSHSVASAPGTFTDLTDAVGTGDLTIDFGTVAIDSMSGNITGFTPNANKSSVTVSIDASNNSLVGLRDAINNTTDEVNASIINDGTGYRIVLTAAETGIENGIQISVDEGGPAADNIDNTGLSRLAFNYDNSVSTTNMLNTVKPVDAAVSINGIDITSSKNTLTDAINGVTLTLKKASPGEVIGVNVTEDTSNIKKNIESFVAKFNALATTLDDLTRVNIDTNEVGLLVGDTATRTIENQLRRMMSDALPGATGSIRSLSDIGISTDKQGKLSIDNSKLQSALENNAASVGALFAAVAVPSDSLVGYVGASDKTQIGSYQIDVTTLASQGAITAGAPIANLTIDANNDNFSVKVDGVQSATLTLSNKTYGSNSELAAEIQRQINGDATLKNAGISVKVSVTGTNELVITSDKYGSASKVEVTAVDTNTSSDLGLSVGSGVDGVDVAGSIGGVAATGSGRFLTGVGSAQGLKIEIIGGSTGNRGVVVYTDGMANKLDSLLSGFLGVNGAISSREDGLKSRLERIDSQRTTLEDHLLSYEERLRRQYAALDVLVAQLQSTSSFLTDHLASMPSLNK